MRYYIYNPISNNHKTSKRVKDIDSSVLFDTTNKNRMNELKQLLKKDDVLYILGGDGTLNYILNNYFFVLDYQLYYYKSGSGNDFYQSLDYDESYIYQINDKHYFINSFGIGFDALIVENTNKLKKKRKISYFIQAFKSINNYTPQSFSLIYNNERHTFNNVWLCSLQNGKYFGGGVKIAKEANINEQEVDLCIGHDLNKFSVLILLFFVKIGLVHLFKKYFFTIKISDLLIENNKSLIAQFDGDILHLNSDIKLTGIKKIRIRKIDSLD